MDETIIEQQIRMFNTYRMNFNSMSFQALKDLTLQLHAGFPQSPCYRMMPELLAQCYNRGYKMQHIVELGGYNGVLAESMLGTTNSILSWVNVELCTIEQKCTSSRYAVKYLTDFAHLLKYVGDVFVSSHTLEHLSAEQVAILVSNIECELVVLEVPLPLLHGTDWNNYWGTHVLTMSLMQLKELLQQYFATVEIEMPHGIIAYKRIKKS